MFNSLFLVASPGNQSSFLDAFRKLHYYHKPVVWKGACYRYQHTHFISVAVKTSQDWGQETITTNRAPVLQPGNARVWVSQGSWGDIFPTECWEWSLAYSKFSCRFYLNRKTMFLSLALFLSLTQKDHFLRHLLWTVCCLQHHFWHQMCGCFPPYQPVFQFSRHQRGALRFRSILTVTAWS